MPGWWLSSTNVVTNTGLMKHVGSSNTRSFFLALAEGLRFIHTPEDRGEKLTIGKVNRMLITYTRDPWGGVLAHAPMMDDSEAKLSLLPCIEDTFKVRFQLFSSNAAGEFQRASLYNSWVAREYATEAQAKEAASHKMINMIFNPSSGHWCLVKDIRMLTKVYLCPRCSAVFRNSEDFSHHHLRSLCGNIDETDPEKICELTGKEKATKSMKRDATGVVRIRHYPLTALRPRKTLEDELEELNLGEPVTEGCLAYPWMMVADCEAYLK